jgi:hypothetical protein
MDLKVRCVGVDWIQLDQNKIPWQDLLNMAMNLQVPQREWNFLTR